MARQMKDSGVEWIGVIPKDWSVSATKYLFKIQSGTTPDSKKEEFWDGDIRWVTPADFKTDDVYVERGRRNISDLGFASCSLQIIPTGSIIFSKRAPVGSVVISNADLSINQGCLACMNKGQSITKYYYYVMSIATEQYELRSSGTTFKEISACTFSNFTLPLPPNDSQRVIADYIDAKSSLICNIIEQTRATIEEYKKLKQAIITEAVTKGVRGARPMKPSGVEWIGDIPEEWSRIKLKSLISHIESGVSVNAGASPAGEGEVGVLKTSCVSFGRFNPDENKSVNKDEISRVACPVQQGCLIVSRMNTPELVGACGYVQQECKNIYLPDRLWQVHISPDFSSKFIYYYLSSKITRSYYASIAVGTSSSMQNISQQDFCCMYCTCPRYAEQQEIATYLDAKCAEIDRIIEMKEQLIEELGSYKKSLIYEYVTGKKEVTA